ncbi:MAG: hypothetical protein ABSG55_04445 [Dehalococcoidia bacterium]
MSSATPGQEMASYVPRMKSSSAFSNPPVSFYISLRVYSLAESSKA